MPAFTKSWRREYCRYDAPNRTRLPRDAPSSDVYGPVESGIRKAVDDLDLPRELERAWLIRAVATARVERLHEMNYRILLGSQISLMLVANTAIAPDMQKALEMYEATKFTYPDLYRNFDFDNWVRYPLNAGILRLDTPATGPALIRITPAGQDFLRFLVSSGLTSSKYG